MPEEGEKSDRPPSLYCRFVDRLLRVDLGNKADGSSDSAQAIYCRMDSVHRNIFGLRSGVLFNQRTANF